MVQLVNDDESSECGGASVKVYCVQQHITLIDTYLVNVHVPRDGFACGWPKTTEDVHDTLWETSFVAKLCYVECRERSLLGGLHDDGAAHRERRSFNGSSVSERESECKWQ